MYVFDSYAPSFNVFSFNRPLIYLKVKVKMKSLSRVLTLCDPLGCSPPRSSFHGIFQERILEWVVISFSRGSSRPRDQTQVSCTAGIYRLSHQGIPFFSI